MTCWANAERQCLLSVGSQLRGELGCLLFKLPKRIEIEGMAETLRFMPQKHPVLGYGEEEFGAGTEHWGNPVFSPLRLQAEQFLLLTCVPEDSHLLVAAIEFSP